METTELKHSDTNVESTTKQNSNSKLFEQVPIENTPFTAVKMDDKWFLTMGKYRLSEKLNSLDEVKAEAMDASWMRIMQIMRIMIEEDKKNNETKTQLN